jgi:hypothetical protein
MKKQIIEWFYGPQDFDHGIKLLQMVSKKNKILGKLIKRGRTRSSFEKLVYELNKVAGLKTIPPPQMQKKTARQEKPVAKQVIKAKELTSNYNLIGKNDINDYPAQLQRLVKENSSLYMLRGKKHAALKRLPDDNSQETIEERLKLVNEIKGISDRLEILFTYFDAFEKTGALPDESVLWPEEQKEQEKKSDNIEDMKNQKKNIQSSITKDRNMLLYGSKTKPKEGEGSPVPEGPKRTTLERRIAKKEAEIKDLDQRIANIS